MGTQVDEYLTPREGLFVTRRKGPHCNSSNLLSSVAEGDSTVFKWSPSD